MSYSFWSTTAPLVTSILTSTLVATDGASIT